MSEAPQKIGKYEVRGLVGKGAMGVVYSAVDPALGRPVAIKTLSLSALSAPGASAHEAELRLRFLREARSAGMLQHPNIITVHELFEEEGTAYLVMELLEGASLSSLLKRKKELSLGEKLSIIDQIASGLSEAHAHRIVHRDLKPSNVFVLKSGVVKVLDFGVAKMGEGELTKAGTVFGTIEYMAPEQVKGASVTARADVFSLGVVAYEVLTGRNPFRGETMAASVFKIVSDTPERLSSEPFRLPAEIDDVVFRALAKPEGERFESMAELRGALQKAASSARIALAAPRLSEEDVVITKDRSEATGPSVEPRVSQWSHVAAQADLLEEIYERGVAAFHEGRFEECVEKMSQVLDEVPVHAMSLHFLAVSEEKLRRQRLAEAARQRAAVLLTAMRDAHRGGEPKTVIDKANELLAIDNESLEARWYRRNAEARLRAVSVGVSSGPKGQPGRSVAGTLSREGAKSFGYFPNRVRNAGVSQSSLGGLRRGAPVVAPAGAPPSPPKKSGGGKGLWILSGVGVLFLALTFAWLSSFGGTKPEALADRPVELPGVRTSPFDGIDDDGTVVLQVPRPRAAFALRQVIPTSVVAGRPTTIGIFGEGLTPELTVTAEGLAVDIQSVAVVDEARIELEIVADAVGEIALVVADREGRRQSLPLRVEPE